MPAKRLSMIKEILPRAEGLSNRKLGHISHPTVSACGWPLPTGLGPERKLYSATPALSVDGRSIPDWTQVPGVTLQLLWQE